jgi:hypothetical protein
MKGGQAAAPNERTRLNTAFNSQQQRDSSTSTSTSTGPAPSASALDDGIDDLEDFDWLQWRKYKSKVRCMLSSPSGYSTFHVIFTSNPSIISSCSHSPFSSSGRRARGLLSSSQSTE